MPPRRALQWSAVAILAYGLLPVGPECVFAQSSQAVCQPPFSWMTNSKGQSPCVVTAYLGGACYNGQFNVPALASDFVYYGPYADVPQQLECECNTVFYNVISACGLCQNHSIISWSIWNHNCSSTSVVGSFPPGIPFNTAIPQWAFQDVLVCRASNMFNVTIAQSVGDSPESTGTYVPSTTVTSSMTSAKALLTSSPPTTSSSPAPSSSAPSTAVIAGGVVGGIVGVAVVAALVAAIISIMRKKRKNAPSVRYSTAPGPPLPPYAGNVFAAQMVQPRLYDPSDPSTFPPAPSSPTYSNPSIRPGAYTGIPEVQR